ncbi:hypothetical protein [Lentibacillus sediminis]|uniref:hypothetical protein n=1 Tax=Lentibacillus sediminis TaxID=1940529 RepID=UPI0018643905|nr:hypothetical protein [Lentibacillus sediminis]
MEYYLSLEVKLLLVNQSNETVEMQYIDHKWEMPKIGPRPPYYYNPRYEQYYPVI